MEWSLSNQAFSQQESRQKKIKGGLHKKSHISVEKRGLHEASKPCFRVNKKEDQLEDIII